MPQEQFPFSFEYFGIQYTNYCNYSCEHCGPCSSPSEDKVSLGYDYISSLYSVISNFGFSEIIFTGGEPLLFYRDVLNLIALARKRSLKTKLVSNGSWAKSPSKALKTITELDNAGLNTLAVSFDKYRLRWGGSIDQIKNIFNAIETKSYHLRVIVYSLEFEEDNRDQKSIFEELKKITPRDSLYSQSLLPIGRAKTLSPNELTFQRLSELDKPCHQVFAPFLSHKRKLYRCCTGLELESKSPLFLGDISSPLDLDRALSSLKDDRLHKALCAIGPTKIFHELPVDNECTSLCEYCVSKMKKDNSTAILNQYVDENSDLIEELYEHGIKELH